MSWKVKTASGFDVESTAPVRSGDRVEVIARILGLKVVEPVEVLSVIEETIRVGFSHGTLPGHPVNCEEAFIVDRRGDGIHLTIRSLSRAAPQQPWRALFRYFCWSSSSSVVGVFVPCAGDIGQVP